MILADAGGTSVSLEILAWIGVPVLIALAGAATVAIRGTIRFAQYLARSESMQTEIQKSNQEIADGLSAYITKNEEWKSGADKTLAVHTFQLSGRGGRVSVKGSANDSI